MCQDKKERNRSKIPCSGVQRQNYQKHAVLQQIMDLIVVD